MKKIQTITPGEILEEEFILPLRLTAYKLATDIRVPPIRISEIIRNKRKITADTALRFAKYFGNSASFWLNIQSEYDLRIGRSEIHNDLSKIHQIRFQKSNLN